MRAALTLRAGCIKLFARKRLADQRTVSSRYLMKLEERIKVRILRRADLRYNKIIKS
jgi:hypothetical protein